MIYQDYLEVKNLTVRDNLTIYGTETIINTRVIEEKIVNTEEINDKKELIKFLKEILDAVKIKDETIFELQKRISVYKELSDKMNLLALYQN